MVRGSTTGSAAVAEMLQLMAGEGSTSPTCWMLDDGQPLQFGLRPEWQVSTAASTQQLIDRVNEVLEKEPAILLPPWGRLPSQRSELQEDILLRCRAHSAGFPLLTAIPASSLISRKSEKFRRQFFASWQPTAIAYVTGGMEGMHSSFRVALMRCVPPGSEEEVMHVFETPPGWLHQRSAAVDDLRRNLRMSGGTTDFGYVLRSVPPPGIPLGFRDLDPRNATRRESLRNYGSATTLGEIFDIRRSRLRTTDTSGQAEGGSLRVISGRDILSDGTIAAPNDDTLWTDTTESELRAGDIIIRSIVAANRGSGLVLAEVRADDLPATATSLLLTLTPKQAMPENVRTFIVEYLRSTLATELIGEIAGNHIDASRLAALPVPLPDEDMEAAITAVQHAIARAAEWRDEASELLASMFDDPTAAASRTRILTESRLLRSRIEAAEAMDDFGYKVRTLYPHPLALRWRIIEAASEDDRRSERHYREILNAGEVLLAYLASVGLALARKAGEPVRALEPVKDGLSRGRGPTLGDWVAILQEISGRRFSKVDDLLGLPDFRQFISQPSVSDCVRDISSRRNDESHVRGVDLIDLPAAVSDATESLTQLLGAADFLIDMPLVISENDEWDELTQRGRVSYRQLSGDHPIVPLQSMLSDSRVEKNSLYVLDTERRLHLLRPFLHGMHCPVCRTLSTFHVDRVSPEGPILKSLEHGHTTTQADMRDPLIAVGVLDSGSASR